MARPARPATTSGCNATDTSGGADKAEGAPIADGGVSALLRAFPFEAVRPSLLYYRHAAGRKETAALREMLMAHGYQTSAHWETGAWGEHNLAWRTDRCAAPGMPGRPLWWSE